MPFGNPNKQSNNGFGQNNGAFGCSSPKKSNSGFSDTNGFFGQKDNGMTKKGYFGSDYSSGFGSDKTKITTPVTGQGISSSNNNTSNNSSTRAVPDNCLKGKISNYSSTGNEDGHYRRFFFQKVLDAIVYHQRFEDILHRFKVRVPGKTDAFGNTEYRDVWVNVHGTIAGGVQIADNSEVEVYGKYKNGVFMARKINVVDSGYTTPINFQHSAKPFLYGTLAIFAAILLIYIGISSNGGFLNNIKSFFKTWLIISVVLTVLYFIAIFSKIGIKTRMAIGKPRKFPLVGILLTSLILSLLLFNSFGIGSVLSGLFSSAISIVVMIIILVIIFKLLLGLF